MPAITLAIGDIAVRQHNGLFSLNDLHKAAGGELRHRPVEFLRLEQSQALLDELQKGGDSHLFLNTTKGRNGGTYACRELVIAYAAWISAAFHLKVIRVFLDAVQPQRAHNPEIDYTRISPSQAQHIKEVVQAIVAAKIQGFAETWARLHKKFRVNSYLELPASRFEEVCNYIVGKFAQPEPAPARTVPPGKMLVDRAKLAAIYIDLGKLQARIDAMGMPAQDTPPSWWQQQSISL